MQRGRGCNVWWRRPPRSDLTRNQRKTAMVCQRSTSSMWIFLSKLLASVPKHYSSKTSEFHPFYGADVKRCPRRAYIVSGKGVIIVSTVAVAPYLGDADVRTRRYYSSSFKTLAEFSNEMMSAQLGIV